MAIDHCPAGDFAMAGHDSGDVPATDDQPLRLGDNNVDFAFAKQISNGPR